MNTVYQVEPTRRREDGSAEKIAFINTALDVRTGVISPGDVEKDIASGKNEMLAETLGIIKGYLTNLKELARIFREVSDSDQDVSEVAIPTTAVTNSLKQQIDELRDDLDDANDEIDTKAPINHAVSALTYGGGTKDNYGHVKLSDVFGSTVENGAAANSVAASQNALAGAYADLDGKKAPNDHAIAASTYGLGTSSLYGHVKASDTYNATSSDPSTVATRKALYDAYKEITDKVDDSSSGLSTKAPKAHASSATTYGVGSGTNYGHLKISDAYSEDNSATGAAANAVAASSWAVYRAYSTLNTAISGKLGTAHANEKATASAFSHVKLSDAYTSSGGAASAGVGASSKAVYDAYTALSGSIVSLQNSVSTLNTQISSFENTKSSIVGSALGKALSMSTSNTWASLVNKIKAITVKSNVGVKATRAGGSDYESPTGGYLWGYIPSNGYYVTSAWIELPRDLIAKAAYWLVYRRLETRLLSGGTDGGWIDLNGTSRSGYGWIRVDIDGPREIFGATWTAGNEGWVMNPNGLCISYNMSYFISQRKYPYYSDPDTGWYSDKNLWLPCKAKNTLYNVVVYYFDLGA